MKTSLIIILWMAFLYVPTKEAMHIFQQNRYQMERYVTWLKDEVEHQRLKIIKGLIRGVPFFIIGCIIHEGSLFTIYVLLLGIYAYVIWLWDHRHEYIQKIKFTYRIRRLFACYVMSYLLLILILSKGLGLRVVIILTPFLFFLPWIWLILIGSIMNPLEQAIRNSYAKEAKAMIADREQLIKIGITGSYGKTSVKNILYTCLAENYYTFMTPHSYNNLMGLTISIRTLLQPLHEVFIAEMGADHVGEIKQLAQFIQPRIGIVSAVGPQHIETFGSQNNILLEKMQLIEQLPPDGIGILNYDNGLIRSYKVQNTCRLITYGIHKDDVEYLADNIIYTPRGTTFDVRHKNHVVSISTCLLGEHNVLNILAAFCTAKALQVSDSTIQKAMKQLHYIEHRLEVREMDHFIILDDAYNSNPEGAAYALDVLAQMSGTRYLMTPGFLDLGDMKTDAHTHYAKQMLNTTDVILLVGPMQTRDIYDALEEQGYPMEHVHVKDSTKEAFAWLRTHVEEGDCVLVENDLPDAFNH